MTKYRIKAYTYLLLVAFFWGIASPIIKFTLQGIKPLPFLTYRFLLSGIIGIIVIFFVRGLHAAVKRNLLIIFIYGFVTTTLALGLLFLGLDKSTVLDTALITTISPLITAIAGAIFFKDVITRQEKIGITIAFFGTVVVVLDPFFKNGGDGIQFTGNLLILGYLLANGLSAVLAKRLTKDNVNSFDISNIAFIVGFITLLPIALIKTSPQAIVDSVKSLSLQYHLGVWYMALISGTLAYGLWTKGQKSIEISEAGVFAYLYPLFSTPLAVLWLGEKITTPFIIGAVFIALGVFIAEYKRKK